MFKLELIGPWAKQTWIDHGDSVRVIGTFSKKNNFHLKLKEPPDEIEEV